VSGDRRAARRADAGASLLLAIAFVVVVGAITASLVSLAASAVGNTATLGTVRDRQYAADGAIEHAIGVVRPLTCADSAGSLVDTSLNANAIRVDWVTACGVVQAGDRGASATATAGDGIVVAQRNVIFSACPSNGEPCRPADVIIRATVNFQQGYGSPVTRTFVQTWSVNG
jgi:hypothetical protein